MQSFPQHPEEFDADPRVSFSKLDNNFILETDDGGEYEYDDALKRWVPVVRSYPPTYWIFTREAEERLLLN